MNQPPVCLFSLPATPTWVCLFSWSTTNKKLSQRKKLLARMFYSSSLIYPPTLLRRCIASSDNRSQCKDISGRPYLKQLVALRLEDMKASSGALLAAVAFAAVAATGGGDDLHGRRHRPVGHLHRLRQVDRRQDLHGRRHHRCVPASYVLRTVHAHLSIDQWIIMRNSVKKCTIAS